MKVELTQRDKKLLTFLGVFVIIVCIGYWGILPQIKAANDYEDEIAEEEVLSEGLLGYKDYMTKVKYRLMPFIW